MFRVRQATVVQRLLELITGKQLQHTVFIKAASGPRQVGLARPRHGGCSRVRVRGLSSEAVHDGPTTPAISSAVIAACNYRSITAMQIGQYVPSVPLNCFIATRQPLRFVKVYSTQMYAAFVFA